MKNKNMKLVEVIFRSDNRKEGLTYCRFVPRNVLKLLGVSNVEVVNPVYQPLLSFEKEKYQPELFDKEN